MGRGNCEDCIDPTSAKHKGGGPIQSPAKVYRNMYIKNLCVRKSRKYTGLNLQMGKSTPRSHKLEVIPEI